MLALTNEELAMVADSFRWSPVVLRIVAELRATRGVLPNHVNRIAELEAEVERLRGELQATRRWGR